MKALPHTYPVDATSHADGPVLISSKGLPRLVSAPPEQFGGPGDQWSPETLLVAAAADCYVLTFRAMAKASKLEWRHLDCHAEGLLDTVDRVIQFTRLTIHATLTLPGGADEVRARQLMDRAERHCLVSNSLKGEHLLIAKVVVER